MAWKWRGNGVEMAWNTGRFWRHRHVLVRWTNLITLQINWYNHATLWIDANIFTSWVTFSAHCDENLWFDPSLHICEVHLNHVVFDSSNLCKFIPSVRLVLFFFSCCELILWGIDARQQDAHAKKMANIINDSLYNCVNQMLISHVIVICILARRISTGQFRLDFM